jgi:DNA-binding transcriptional ArsR family regulator
LLREGERTVGALQAALELDSSTTSQQLTALRKQGLVESRREGTNVYYRVKDRRTLELLELAKKVIASNLEEGQALLDGLAGEDFGPPALPRRRRRGNG